MGGEEKEEVEEVQEEVVKAEVEEAARAEVVVTMGVAKWS